MAKTTQGKTGSAVCPYCASDQAKVMKGEHIVSAPLVTNHVELLRFRDESQDPQVDRRTGKLASELTEDELHEAVVASVPVMREVELDGLTVKVPANLRPAFRHQCPTSGQLVVLYGDSEGGGIQ
jgi:hypothetical protein